MKIFTTSLVAAVTAAALLIGPNQGVSADCGGSLTIGFDKFECTKDRVSERDDNRKAIYDIMGSAIESATEGMVRIDTSISSYSTRYSANEDAVTGYNTREASGRRRGLQVDEEEQQDTTSTSFEAVVIGHNNNRQLQNPDCPPFEPGKTYPYPICQICNFPCGRRLLEEAARLLGRDLAEVQNDICYNKIPELLAKSDDECLQSSTIGFCEWIEPKVTRKEAIETTTTSTTTQDSTGTTDDSSSASMMNVVVPVVPALLGVAGFIA